MATTKKEPIHCRKCGSLLVLWLGELLIKAGCDIRCPRCLTWTHIEGTGKNKKKE